ncbi:MAG: sigma-70 family RNA polymerase sigma factor [Clostridiaceae bacterium]
MEYKNLSDEKLAELSHEGDDTATTVLIDRYRETVRYEIKSLFIKGGDSEDLYQEGFIGLYNAIKDYNPDKNTTFKTFARIVIARQLMSAVQKAARKKHDPLNTYLSFSEQEDMDDIEGFFNDRVTQGQDNPLTKVIDTEAFKEYNDKIIKLLTPLELKVLMLYLQGKKYSEIAMEIKRNVKSVDNSIQRIRKKLDSYQA